MKQQTLSSSDLFSFRLNQGLFKVRSQAIKSPISGMRDEVFEILTYSLVKLENLVNSKAPGACAVSTEFCQLSAWNFDLHVSHPP